MTEFPTGDSAESGAYERPDDRWICGKSKLGRPCRRGPSAKGVCQLASACEPSRDGAAWNCARPISAGGPCAKGPGADGTCGLAAPPCVPRKSWRRLRGALTLWVSLVTLGGLTLLLGTDWGRHVIDPGAMIQGHAELTDCKTCHVAFDKEWSHWVLAAFRANDPLADSKKCLACHEKGDNPLRPHSLPTKVLAQHTEDIEATAPDGPAPLLHMASDRLFERKDEKQAELACAACHKEHKGAAFDAAVVSDNRCQGCHTEKFDSLAEGHPAFESYPYMRRPRISFNHHKHFRKNFADAKVSKDKVPETCATCHLPDQSGRFMVVQTFEQTCANCHTKDIEGESVAGARGIAVLGIPALDVETLTERGHDVGHWPELAQAPDLTPFVKLLLAGDPRIAADLKQLAALDLEDLSSASAAQLATVRRVAWALKELLFDLTVSGAETVELRLATQVEGGVDRAALGRLLGHIPLDVIRAARRAWFPGLKKEVLRYREEKAAHFEFFPEPRVRLAALADEKEIAALVSFLFVEPEAAPRPDHIQLAQSGDLLNDSEGLLDKESLRFQEYQDLLEEDSKSDNSLFKNKRPAPAPAAKKTAPKPAEPKSEDTAKAPPAPEKAAPEKVATEKAAPKAEPKVAQPEPEPKVAEPEPEPEPDVEPAVVVELDEPLDPNLDPEVWAKLGGWYRRDETLYYRAVTHRDPFMGAWLDLAATLHGTPAEDMGQPLLAVFRAKDTPGKCTKCHSIDRQESGMLEVNWQPFLPNPERQGFTTFNHMAHFSLVEKKGCITCHQLEPDAKFAESYKDFDPNAFAANFKPLKREVCAECHVQESAGDACVQCHRYHVGEFPLTPVHTLIADMPLTNEAPPAPKTAAAKPAASQPAKPAVSDLWSTASGPPTSRSAASGPAKSEPAAPEQASPVPLPRPKPARLKQLASLDRAAEPLTTAQSIFEKAQVFRQQDPDPTGADRIDGNVVIQFTSVRSLQSAWGEQARLKERFAELLSGQELTVKKVELTDRGTFYRVMAEPFPNTEGAQQVCDRIKQEDQACLVVLRKGN